MKKKKRRQKKRAERSTAFRLTAAFLWLIVINRATVFSVNAFFSARLALARQPGKAAIESVFTDFLGFVFNYGLLLIIVPMVLTALLSAYGILPGTGKYKIFSRNIPQRIKAEVVKVKKNR